MASKQKNRSKSNRKSNNALASFGIEISNLELDDEGDDLSDTGDDDLESELQALLSGKQVLKPPVKRQKPVSDMIDVEKMAKECMRESSIDEDDDAVLEDNDLLAELQSLTKDEEHDDAMQEDEENLISDSSKQENSSSVIDILSERLGLYKEAVEAAKTIGDNSKVRRYGRAVKTLESLLSSAKSGRSINEEDIPPVVAIPKPKVPSVPESAKTTQISESSGNALPSVPSRPAPVVPQASLQHDGAPESVDSKNPISAQLIARRNQYKIAALNAKRSGDNDTALKYVKIAKKFDVVIEAAENGQQVDLSNMPPAPSDFSVLPSSQTLSPAVNKAPQVEAEKTQKATSSSIEEAALAAANEPADPDMFNAPKPPATILEALEQRLEKYCSTRDIAKTEGNNSKARRLNRIVQQYEGAIKSYKAGKPVAFDELPTPPGFGPIPVEGGTSISSQKESKDQHPASNEGKKAPVQSHVQQPADQPHSHESSQPLPPRKPKIQRAATSTIMENQLKFLLERQRLFRQAALESKKNGDIQQAKEYLRMSKGFESMIEATKCGLPIDATTIPTPPQLESDFVIIDTTECVDQSTDGNLEPFPNLEKELQQQIEMCTRNKEHFMRLGDVSSASKFEKLCLDTKKDLAFIQHLWRNGEAVPRFHYEMKLFSLVQCNVDLSDNELEVLVERGINLPGKPDDLDAYVKIEFAIPSDNPQRAKTHTVRDTNNPTYHETFKFEINRKSRSQVRQFKRQALKLEVWSKGGFFRSDTLLGTALVKLVDLETKCSIHDSFDLLDGRKTCGGKLEVKVRVRDPLLAKQVEEIKEKWLVIGS